MTGEALPSDMAERPIDRPGPAHIIVSEPTGVWAVALRRELGSTIVVEETRSLSECWNRLAESPGSLVVIEVTTGNFDGFLDRMTRFGRRFPRARVVVVANRWLAGHEWLLREAGAVAFVTSPRRLCGVAALARRHLATQPVCSVSTVDRIWNRLPWTSQGERREPTG